MVLLANAPHCSAPGFKEERFSFSMRTYSHSFLLQIRMHAGSSQRQENSRMQEPASLWL